GPPPRGPSPPSPAVRAPPYPAEPIPDLVPKLAVEVLSAGNTKKEMARKLRDYFVAGVELVWVIDPAKRQGKIYTAPDEFHLVTEHEAMDGGDVLPGFRLPLSELFALLPEPPQRRKAKRANGKTNGREGGLCAAAPRLL